MTTFTTIIDAATGTTWAERRVALDRKCNRQRWLRRLDLWLLPLAAEKPKGKKR